MTLMVGFTIAQLIQGDSYSLLILRVCVVRHVDEGEFDIGG